MRISVIILSYNTKQLLADCITSAAAACNHPGCEVIVVDNHSTDGSVEMVRERFPQVQLIQLDQNLGFSKANNIGFRSSRGAVVIFLNSDTVIRGDALDRIASHFEDHSDVGVIGPKIVDGSGRPTASYQRCLDVKKLYLGWDGWKVFFDVERYRMNYPVYRFNSVQDVEWVSGACLAVRREVFEEAGCWDENYFLFYEDMDLCLQVAKLGYRIVYYPDAEIVHLFGQSSKDAGADVSRHIARSKLYYFRKNFPFWHAWAARLHSAITT